ncbi:MAG: hypothetical protein M1371_00685 [Actinobacteria bacterium]|nr:hypothetical protein [Actinomycetota bacterium]
MKPGGLLYLTTPNLISLWPIIELILDTFKLVPPLKNNQHNLKFTFSQLKGIVFEGKFKLKSIGSINHLSPFLSAFSWTLAKKFFNFEVKYLKEFGPIIWMVAEK